MRVFKHITLVAVFLVSSNTGLVAKPFKIMPDKDYHIVGTVIPFKRIIVKSPVNGRLTLFSKGEGSKRKKGQELGVVTPQGGELEQLRNLARVAIDSAKAAEALAGGKREARGLIERAEKLYQKLEQQPKAHKLQAPFRGIISRIIANHGEFVKMGDTILEFDNDKFKRIEAFVPLFLVRGLGIGDVVESVLYFGEGVPMPARIAQIRPIAEKNGKVRVLFDLPSKAPGGTGMKAILNLSGKSRYYNNTTEKK